MTLPLLLAGAALFAADDVREIRRNVPLSPQGRVSVDTYKGLVKVTAWDRPQVEIHVRIEADGWNLSSRNLVRDTEIEIDSSADSLRLKTRYPKQTGRDLVLAGLWLDNVSQPYAKYTIRMPRTAQLRIKDYKSEIEIDGLSSSLDIDTYKGDVRVFKQNGGAVAVKTYKSDARVELTRHNERTSFETYRGSYLIDVPRDARFDLDSNVGRRGGLRTGFSLLHSTSRGDSFRSPVNGGGPTMSLKGYRGDFSLR